MTYYICCELVSDCFATGFCVRRHDVIQTFVPESYWSIDLSVRINVAEAAGGSIILLDWARQRLFDEDAARVIMRLIEESAEQGLLCSAVTVTQGKNVRPQPMNTVQMLKMASKSLGETISDGLEVFLIY